MAPPNHATQNGDASNGDAIAASSHPDPGRLILARPYYPQEYIDRQLGLSFTNPAMEIQWRFEGVNMIEALCDKMQLWVLIAKS
jgi:hypothetical protein